MSTTERIRKSPERNQEWYEIGKRLEESQNRILKELENEHQPADADGNGVLNHHDNITNQRWSNSF